MKGDEFNFPYIYYSKVLYNNINRIIYVRKLSDMNIQKVELEKQYKWKQLCETVDIKVSEGNSRKKDIKKLESLCRFTKEGQWFTIHEIYDKPKEIEDKRKGREFKNSINSLMASAIMYKVINTQEGYYCGGINNWLFEIGVVNKEFNRRNQIMFNNMKEGENGEFINEMNKDFISFEYSSLRSHFISALEKIRKTKLADYYITCKIGYSEDKEVKWTKELTEEDLKYLYNEKDKLYKEYGVVSEFDLLYGNENLKIKKDLTANRNIKKDVKSILYNKWEANYEYTAYKVILKNTSDKAMELIDKKFFDGYSLLFLKDSIYVKRRKCAEERQNKAIKKYKKIDREGTFFDRVNKLYVDSLDLSEVELNKINGIYVELWEAIYNELMR